MRHTDWNMARLVLKEAKQRALERVKRSTRPTLVGHVAIELDCSLAEAENVLLDLLADRLIRRVTSGEMEYYDIRDGFLAA